MQFPVCNSVFYSQKDSSDDGDGEEAEEEPSDVKK